MQPPCPNRTPELARPAAYNSGVWQQNFGHEFPFQTRFASPTLTGHARNSVPKICVSLRSANPSSGPATRNRRITMYARKQFRAMAKLPRAHHPLSNGNLRHPRSPITPGIQSRKFASPGDPPQREPALNPRVCHATIHNPRRPVSPHQTKICVTLPAKRIGKYYSHGSIWRVNAATSTGMNGVLSTFRRIDLSETMRVVESPKVVSIIPAGWPASLASS